MRLYVINLDRSGDRLARIGGLFSTMGLEFTRITAVDVRVLSDDALAQVQKCNIWTQDLMRGEIACFLSHARALQQFVDDNAPYGVIFEDDVELGRGAASLLKDDSWLENMAHKTGEMIDLVKLETSGKKLLLGQAIPIEDQDNFTLARLKSTHMLAAAYLISRPAAMRLLEMMQQQAAPFDHFLFNFGLGIAQHFTLYQLEPAIAIQAGLASTLEGERADKKQQAKSNRCFRQTLFREIRRLKNRAITGLWGIKTNLFTRDRWQRVSFNK